jgi:hypothetical protein
MDGASDVGAVLTAGTAVFTVAPRVFGKLTAGTNINVVTTSAVFDSDLRWRDTVIKVATKIMCDATTAMSIA